MRFKYRSHSQNIYDSETGRIYTGGKAICELLNELNNEINTYDAGNQLLKRSFDECRKENEQLKSKNRGLQSELQIFKEDVTHSNLQINKLADENEQLKARVDYLERKIQRERKSYQKQHEKWEKELKSE